MKRLALVALCLAFTLSALAQTTFYIESRTSSGAITDVSLYEETGAWYSVGSS